MNRHPFMTGFLIVLGVALTSVGMVVIHLLEGDCE